MSYDPTQQTPYERFGLAPNADEAAIKAAYAAALKANRPEDDPGLFAQLRADYKLLRQAAKSGHRAGSSFGGGENQSPSPETPSVSEVVETEPVLRETVDDFLKRTDLQDLAADSGDLEARGPADDLVEMIPELLLPENLQPETRRKLNFTPLSEPRPESLWASWRRQFEQLSLADQTRIERALIARLLSHMNEGHTTISGAPFPRRVMDLWMDMFAWHLGQGQAEAILSPQDHHELLNALEGVHLQPALPSAEQIERQQEEDGWRLLWPVIILVLVLIGGVIVLAGGGVSGPSRADDISNRVRDRIGG